MHKTLFAKVLIFYNSLYPLKIKQYFKFQDFHVLGVFKEWERKGEKKTPETSFRGCKIFLCISVNTF